MLQTHGNEHAVMKRARIYILILCSVSLVLLRLRLHLALLGLDSRVFLRYDLNALRRLTHSTQLVRAEFASTDETVAYVKRFPMRCRTNSCVSCGENREQNTDGVDTLLGSATGAVVAVGAFAVCEVGERSKY